MIYDQNGVANVLGRAPPPSAASVFVNVLKQSMHSIQLEFYFSNPDLMTENFFM